MATIQTLAPELLDQIFEQVPSNTAHRDLPSSALVCRDWRDPAQHALFSSVELTSSRQANAWLQSAARPRYRTKHLGLGFSLGMKLGLTVIKSCPFLSSFEAPIMSRLPDEDEADDWRQVSDGAFQWCLSAAGVRQLTLRARENVPARATPLTFRLEHLELHLFQEFTLNFIEHLLMSSNDSLKTLYLVGPAGQSIDILVLTKFFSRVPFLAVTSLVIETLDTLHLKQLIASLPSLTFITLREAEPHIVKALGAAHLPKLEELTVVTLRQNPMRNLKSIKNLIESGKLSGLRRLRLPSLSIMPVVDFADGALWTACEARSISIYCCWGSLTVANLQAEYEAMLAATEKL